MTCYVDPLFHRGWKLRGQSMASSHLVTDGELFELHALAQRIGLRREWFQDHPRLPHYDLTARRRRAAIEAGAREIGSRELVQLMRARAERRAMAWPLRP